jgi:phospholipase C
MVGGLRDGQALERLASEHPGELMRRREFLARLALAAGLASGAAAALSPGALIAEAAARQRANPMPSPRNLPIDTFVVLMMENRSFDHYLGWLPGADGRQAGLSYTDALGNSFHTHRLAPDFQGCAHLDPDHSWEGGRAQLDGGRMDGFLRARSDPFALGYYDEADLPFLPSLARAFTAYDRFFCSLLGPTYPNREYMHAAQSYGMRSNSLPPRDGFPDSTIFQALGRAGVDGRCFYTDVPVAALWGRAGLGRCGQVQEYYERCAAGTLPALSFVDPAFEDDGSGTSLDEHPHGDVRAGQAFMSDVVHAFVESPQWRRGALFIVYDEWGGFFDHVPPPRVPDARANGNSALDFGQMGFRIPAVAVSPWARRSHVDHGVYGFESILKMVEYRYGLPPLGVRDRFAANIARSFDFESKPRFEPARLPAPREVMSRACEAPELGLINPGEPLLPGGQLVPGEQPYRPTGHDLADLLHSGYLEQLGFEYRPATAANTFRQPADLHPRLSA